MAVKLKYQGRSFVDVTKSGIVVGTGLTTAQRKANRLCLQEAAQAAIDQGKTLLLPAGTIEVDWDTSTTPDRGGSIYCVVYVKGILRMRGQGFAKTIINAPTAPTLANSHLFYVDGYTSAARLLWEHVQIACTGAPTLAADQATSLVYYDGGNVAPSLGAITATGAGAGPTPTLSGQPIADFPQCYIECTTGGALGTMVSRFSDDNGVSVSLNSTSSTLAPYLETVTGVRVNYPAGTYVTGAKYSFALSIGSRVDEHRFYEVKLNAVGVRDCVQSNQGNPWWKLYNCELTGWVNGINATVGSTVASRFDVFQSRFLACGVANFGGNTYGSHITKSPGVALRVDGCSFYRTYRYAVENVSTSTVTPLYDIFTNNYLDSTCSGGVVTNPNRTPIIDRSVVACSTRGLVFRGPAVVNACSFTTAGLETDSTIPSSAEVQVGNCQFYRPALVGSSIVKWNHASTLNIARCQAFFSATDAAAYAIQQTAGTVNAHTVEAHGAGAGLYRGTGGAGRLRRLRTLDAIKGVVADGTMTSLDVSDCSLLSTGVGIHVPTGGAHDWMRGRNNEFGGTPLQLDDASTYRANLAPRAGVQPTTVAGASTLSLSLNYDTYRVTGTATIDNIFIGGTAKLHGATAGTVTLVAAAGSALTFSAAGNIKAKSGAVRVAEQSYVFVSDPNTGFLYEV